MGREEEEVSGEEDDEREDGEEDGAAASWVGPTSITSIPFSSLSA